MIFRAILLELTGGAEELELEARVLETEGPRSTRCRFEAVALGGLRLEDDGWHIVGTGGELGPQAHQDPALAIQVLLAGRGHELARRLAP